MEWLKEWWKRLRLSGRDADPPVGHKHNETLTTPQPTPKEPSDLRKPKSKLPR